MQKFFDNWRDFIQEKEPKKEQKLLNEAAAGWMKRADQRVINDVMRAAEEGGADDFAKRLLLGFLKIETGGKAKYTFYNPEMAKHKGTTKRPSKVDGTRPIGPFQILQSTQSGYTKYGYDPGQFGDPFHQAQVVLKFIERNRKRVGDDPARIYLSWNQGVGGANTIYKNLGKNPNEQIGSGGGLAKNMRNNFSGGALSRYGISSKNEITPQMFVDRYAGLLGFEGDSPSSSPATDQSVKNVIISGNSHAGAMAAQVKQHYENLGQKSGVKYNFVEIHDPQGKGGQVSALNKKMDGIQSQLKGDSVAAIIHIGTNKGHGDLDELIGKYSNLSNNVTFVGTPEANQSYEHYKQRTDFNTELKNKINNLDGVSFVNTFGLTSQKDLSDNVHLRKAAYGSLWSQIQGDINFDSPTSTSSSMAAGSSTSTTPQPTMRGQFVHGFSRDDRPDFNFDDFYKKLDDAGLSQHLGDWGKDYKYGRAHDAARTALSDYEANSTTTADPAAETPVAPENMPLGATPSQTAPIPPGDMPMAAAETAPIPPEDMPVSGARLSENIISHEYNLFENRWSSEDLIKVDMTLRFNKEFSFYGNVLNQIRAVKGITIAKADEAGLVKISPDKRLVLLHLKFMPDRPLSQYIYYLKTELKKITDKDGDRVLSIDLKSIPEKTKS